MLLCLRDGLRSGDVYVPGSRRYADPASYLYTPAQWEAKRIEFCSLVGKSPHARQVLEVAENELATALTDSASLTVCASKMRAGVAGLAVSIEGCRGPVSLGQEGDPLDEAGDTA